MVHSEQQAQASTACACHQQGQHAKLATKIIGIDLNVMLPLLRHIFVAEDRFDRTSWLARATINTLIGIDVEMFDGFKLSFIFAWVDAINRANVHTSGVLGSNTGFCDDIDCHAFSFSLASICKCGSTLNQLQLKTAVTRPA
jgi:heme/copper-type cytochrome/quinol oxidase subunit 4